MKKIVVKLLMVLLIVSNITLFINNNVDASSVKEITSSAQLKLASGYTDQFKDVISGEYKDETEASEKISSFIAVLVTATRIIGVAVAIIMLLVVAMKYMTAAPGDKAEIKKYAIPYVVGAAVLFGFSGILSLIQIFAGSFKKAMGTGGN